MSWDKNAASQDCQWWHGLRPGLWPLGSPLTQPPVGRTSSVAGVGCTGEDKWRGGPRGFTEVGAAGTAWSRLQPGAPRLQLPQATEPREPSQHTETAPLPGAAGQKVAWGCPPGGRGWEPQPHVTEGHPLTRTHSPLGHCQVLRPTCHCG